MYRLVQRGWHNILSSSSTSTYAIVRASLSKQVDYFDKQATGLSHEGRASRCPSHRSTVRHQETILHVDESRRTAVRTSSVDGSMSLVWFTGSFTFELRSALHASSSLYQSGQLPELLLLTSLKYNVLKEDFITKSSQYSGKTFNFNVISPSLVDAMTSLINITNDQRWLAKRLSRPPRQPIVHYISDEQTGGQSHITIVL